MVGETGNKDKKDARALALVLLAAILVLLVAAIVALPGLAEFNEQVLAPGLGLRQSAAVAFGATVLLLIVFAIAAGDGLLGELQFMLAGFFSFFTVLWLLIAWIL